MLRSGPWVVGEAAADLLLVVRVDDHERAEAAAFGARERPANRTKPSPARPFMNVA
jgi:hypothetical protein